ncbi:MAG: class I SAM-dependent methyltransferase [Thermoguttaceae bacterium]|nr:class I SAM-dependent methyltransferase [Thermoguttaceae bacterium]
MDNDYLNLIRNAAFPEGELGVEMIKGMNCGHSDLTDWGFAHVTFGNRILDVGCGGGAALAKLAQTFPGAYLAGCDVSPLAVQYAQKFNEQVISAGRMEIKRSGVPNLDYLDNSFDTVYSVESLYFWQDAVEGLKDILRVLSPGGTFMTVLEMVGGNMSDHHEEIAKELNMFCPTPEELDQIVQLVGFVNVSLAEDREKGWICITAKKP